MPLCIILTLLAAATQTLRFALQKRLGGGTLTPAGATFARFLFAAPLALAAAGVTLAMTGGIAAPSPAFWGFVLMGGVAQILATELTVTLFQMRNFAVGVAFTKTEVVQTALFSLAVLGEVLGIAGLVAVAFGLAGVLLLTLHPAKGAPLGQPALIGVLSGALFAVASVGFRGATLELGTAPYGLRAIVALAAATAIQTALMALWLTFRQPGEVGRVLSAWRATAPVGLAGLAGSYFWFAAFAMERAAYVRALGQIEVVFSLAVSALIFRERLGRREAAGVALIFAATMVLILSSRSV